LVGGAGCKWMNDIKPIGYLIMAVGNQFGLTISNRSDTFMSYTVNKLDEFFVFMLYGGDKSSQIADIAIAKQLARNLKGCLQ